ncbi:MAG: aminoacyl-tRNA hydrolase [Dethiobacter sp.]|jgi:PTH1 family peptidyl-tRNA hydrolase|nr:aminoacyl-tRNA hydrolase [Dethiobacter sp.]
MMIILGLGNPAPRYLLTRHNAGFRVIDCLSGKTKIPLYKSGYHSFYARGVIGGQDVVLAKPMTFMNNSGLAAAALCRAFGVPSDRLLVICDDLDLPPGRLRLRSGGGSGGQNGLNSIIYHLHSEEFLRLRIGIGRPVECDAADYVLEELAGAEMDEFDRTLALAVDGVMVLLSDGISAAMNKINAKGQA